MLENVMFKYLLIGSLALLTACGGNVKEVACTGDWHDVGYQTALDGEHVRTFEKYKTSCGESLVAEAKDRYLDGYTKGVIEYCTYDNGYKLGKRNIKIESTCPYEISMDFRRGYKVGNIDFQNAKQLFEDSKNDAEKKLHVDEMVARDRGRQTDG